MAASEIEMLLEPKRQVVQTASLPFCVGSPAFLCVDSVYPAFRRQTCSAVFLLVHGSCSQKVPLTLILHHCANAMPTH